ncbi:hypothetical protein P5X00_32515 [Paraburkholderia sp. A2RO-4L]
MKKNPKKPPHGGGCHYESVWLLELARGASHIASMLSAETLDAAVREVMQEFVAAQGSAELDTFCWLLAERLEKRECAAGAARVREFDASGLSRQLLGEA